MKNTLFRLVCSSHSGMSHKFCKQVIETYVFFALLNNFLTDAIFVSHFYLFIEKFCVKKVCFERQILTMHGLFFKKYFCEKICVKNTVFKYIIKLYSKQNQSIFLCTQFFKFSPIIQNCTGIFFFKAHFTSCPCKIPPRFTLNREFHYPIDILMTGYLALFTFLPCPKYVNCCCPTINLHVL